MYSFLLWQDKGFLSNRALRIIPPFLLALATSYFVHGVVFFFDLPMVDFAKTADAGGIFVLKSVLKNLISIGDYRIHVMKEDYYVFVRYVWAVAIEVQFYLVVAFFFWFGHLCGVSPKRIFLCTFIIFVLTYLIGMTVELPPYLGLIKFSPYFLLGICMYFYFRQKGVVGKNKVQMLYGVGLIVAIILSVVCFYKYTNRGASDIGAFVPMAIFLFSVTVFGLFANIANFPSGIKKVDKFLGDLSYPLYLQHYAVEILLYALFPIKNFLIFIGGIAFSLLISAGAFWLIEPLMAKLRDKVRGHVLSAGGQT